MMSTSMIVSTKEVTREEKIQHLEDLAINRQFIMTWYHDAVMIGHSTALRAHTWLTIDYSELDILIDTYKKRQILQANDPLSWQEFVCVYLIFRIKKESI